MDTLQINDILKQDSGKAFVGTFSWDTMPDLSNGEACVVNTHCSARPGQHWVSYAHLDGSLEFFDSYGRAPRFYKVLPLTVDRMNRKPLQGYDSGVCGQWCTYYLLYRLRGYSMENIVSRFGSDLHANDHFVAEFINELYDLDLEVHSINSTV